MSRCKHTKQGANDYYDDNVDRFFEERDEAFLAQVVQSAKKYLSNTEGDVTPSVLEFTKNIEVEFEFLEEGEWLTLEYESAMDSCADQAYEEEKDRRMNP